MNFDEQLRRIEGRLEQHIGRGALPGRSAHYRMAPPGRPLDIPGSLYSSSLESSSSESSSSGQGAYKRAAVLLLLYPAGPRGDIHLPLILRPEDDAVHGGQIAFPGGHHEKGEGFPVDTALREAQEELGIERESVHVIGELSPLFVGVSGVIVTPVLASAREKPEMTPDPVEVAAFFSIPLQQFREKPLCGEFASRRGSLKAPYFATEAGRVWGATAMILSELIELVYSGE
ncbi:MAG: NUDIX hydrolase [Spirochaetaceae bacterium]